MTTQPEALRMADALYAVSSDPAAKYWERCLQAAAELRRLHEVEEAAKNLIKVKGRYHTEQAFNKLKELVK